LKDNRKKLVNEYKERKLIGGVYKITNTLTKGYLLGHTNDIRAMQNRFDFSISTDSCIHPKLQKDWREFGGSVFTFEVLETLQPKEGQSQAEFVDELLRLEEIYRWNFDASQKY
jgi:hypothetical protein